MLKTLAKLHNRFDFEIYDVETGEVEFAKAENIVLNQAYGQLMNMYSYIGVGTGSGTLSPTRTGLFSELLKKITTNVETVYDTPLSGHRTVKVVYGESEANGNWTEVGLGYQSTPTTYATHAFITDAEGNPITINKTITKIITVYATVFVEVLTPTTGVNMSFGQYNAILRTCLMTSYNNDFIAYGLRRRDGGPAIASVIGTLGNSSIFTMDVANKRWHSGTKRFGTSVVNYPIRGIGMYTNISSISYGALALPHAGLFESKAFSAIGIGTGDGTATEFDFPLDNIKPESETIYVNGVAKTRGVDYTVHYGLKSTSNTLFTRADSDIGIGMIDEEIELPQPPGDFFTLGAATVTSIVIKNGTFNSGGHFFTEYNVQLSEDGTTWVSAGSGAMVVSGTYTLNSFTPAKYKFVKVYMKSSYTADGNTNEKLRNFTIYATPPTAQKQIKFATPIPNGHAITSDFAVDYIPKSSNFVLDVAAEINYGSV